MLNKLISRCISHQIDQGILKQEEREAYEYGYFLISLEVINISVMAAIGILFHTLIPLIFFTLCLMFLRKYAGGVHASSYVRCATTSAIMEFIIAVLLHSGLWLKILPYLLPAALCSILIIWFLCPVAASTKPLTDSELLQYRLKAHQRLAIETAVGLILFLVQQKMFLFLIAANLLIIAVAMLIAFHHEKNTKVINIVRLHKKANK